MTDSGANTAGGTTAYAYDKLGRVRVRTDANGLKTYVLYDDAGRHVGDVDGAGHLTEYRYDANNRLVGTIDYRNAVSGGTLSTLATPTTSVVMASIRPGADTQDVSSWVVYDAEGRVVQTILGDGSTTISTYDAAGRLQKTTAYVNKIAQATVDGFVAAPPTAVIAPTASAGDAVARRFYDKDGLLIGTLSGEGYLTRNVYDSAGQLVATTAYATQTSAGLRASGSFTALLGSAGTSAQDRTSHLVYDGQGLLRYAVDALNQVVRRQPGAHRGLCRAARHDERLHLRRRQEPGYEPGGKLGQAGRLWRLRCGRAPGLCDRCRGRGHRLCLRQLGPGDEDRRLRRARRGIEPAGPGDDERLGCRPCERRRQPRDPHLVHRARRGGLCRRCRGLCEPQRLRRGRSGDGGQGVGSRDQRR